MLHVILNFQTLRKAKEVSFEWFNDAYNPDIQRYGFARQFMFKKSFLMDAMLIGRTRNMDMVVCLWPIPLSFQVKPFIPSKSIIQTLFDKIMKTPILQ